MVAAVQHRVLLVAALPSVLAAAAAAAVETCVLLAAALEHRVLLVAAAESRVLPMAAVAGSATQTLAAVVEVCRASPSEMFSVVPSTSYSDTSTTVTGQLLCRPMTKPEKSVADSAAAPLARQRACFSADTQTACPLLS